MARLLRRADELARARQRRGVGQVAEQIRELLGSASIDVEESRIIVSGRGLLKRWLSDPRLRFMSGSLK